MIQQHKHKLALADPNGRLTFNEMSARISSIASALLQSNVGEGDKVAVFMRPTMDWTCSLLAIMRVGATYVPLDPRVSIARLAVVVSDCKPALCLHDDATADSVAQLDLSGSTTITNVSRVAQTSTNVTLKARKDGVAAIFYTSGMSMTYLEVEE